MFIRFQFIKIILRLLAVVKLFLMHRTVLWESLTWESLTTLMSMNRKSRWKISITFKRNLVLPKLQNPMKSTPRESPIHLWALQLNHWHLQFPFCGRDWWEQQMFSRRSIVNIQKRFLSKLSSRMCRRRTVRFCATVTNCEQGEVDLVEVNWNSDLVEV